jgi:TRAP-type C4-dicarboxylate transport system permease small subunit
MSINKNTDKSSLERVRVLLNRVEDGILFALVLLMIGMAVTQILLRNLFQTAIIWGDMLVRMLVLWIGLVGGMIASRQDTHISIDIVARYLPRRAKVAVQGIVKLFASSVCAVMSWYSLQFVKMEFEVGGIAFANVPAWACEAIIPFAFAVIALRYFTLSLINFAKLFKSGS